MSINRKQVLTVIANAKSLIESCVTVAGLLITMVNKV